MSPQSPDRASQGQKPSLNLLTDDRRRPLSIFSRRESPNEAIMSRNMSSMLLSTLNCGRRPTERPRLQIHPVTLGGRRAKELECWTPPASARQDTSAISPCFDEELSPILQLKTACTPLSAAVLEHKVLKTRVSAWVEGVTKSGTTSDFSYMTQPKPNIETNAATSDSVGPVIQSVKQKQRHISAPNPVKSNERAKNMDAEHMKRRLRREASTSSSSLSRDIFSGTEGSQYGHSSKTSVDSQSHDSSTWCPMSASAMPPRSAEAVKYAASLFDPSRAGVFDAASRHRLPININKPLPLTPIRLECQRSYSSLPGSRSTPVLEKANANNEEPLNPFIRPSSAQSCGPRRIGTTRTCHNFDQFDQDFMRTSPPLPRSKLSIELSSSASGRNANVSPDNLQIKPLQVRAKGLMLSDDWVPEFPELEIMLSRALDSSSPALTPTIPRRSSKRCRDANWDARGSSQTSSIKPTKNFTVAPVAQQVPSNNSGKMASRANTPSPISISNASITSPPTSTAGTKDGPSTTCSVQHSDICTALDVGSLLHELSSLNSIDELMTRSTENKVTQSVYAENELFLLKAVLKTQSPGAWELRELTTLRVDEELEMESDEGYTSVTYMREYLRDKAVVVNLMGLISERCSTFLRTETRVALTSPDTRVSSRFEEALYRIWCFCIIFGPQKEKQADLDGQLDWLRGGVVASQQGCFATVVNHVDIKPDSILFNPPDCFGQCNKGGLSADDVYDMIEIWDCLAVLLEEYANKMELAGAHGVFDKCDIESKPAEAQEQARVQALEDWIFHVLTLGPPAILSLAGASSDVNAGFSLAKKKGWTDWSWVSPAKPFDRTENMASVPTMETVQAKVHTLSLFLRVPLRTLYRERINAAPLPPTSATRETATERSVRIHNMAAEIRAARCRTIFTHLPWTDLSNERPWSVMTRTMSVASDRTLVDTPNMMSLPKSTEMASPIQTYMSLPSWQPLQTKFRGSLPVRSVSPLIEETETALQWNIQRPGEDDATYKASMRPGKHTLNEIVLMGFTVSQAREALRITYDNGFQVKSAADWLLAQQ